MRPVVLIGSLSKARQIHYQLALESYGIEVALVSNDEDYFQKLSGHVWSFLLMECSMIWGDLGTPEAESVDEENWRDTPLVLFAGTIRFAQPTDEVRFPIQALFQRFPSRIELLSAINSAWTSPDPFVVEESDFEHESCCG